MSKRLAFLEQLVKSGSTDPMALYGLALEYRSLDRVDDAIQAFATLREKHPDYVPMYLMAGGVLEKVGRKAEAKAWLEQGITAAKAKGDSHALSELQGALNALVVE